MKKPSPLIPCSGCKQSVRINRFSRYCINCEKAVGLKTQGAAYDYAKADLESK